MRAISLWQPWATLWLLTNPDEKVFETRHWYTGIRGPILVHAAKKRDAEVRKALTDPYFKARLAEHGLKPESLAFGAIIGQVDLIDCRIMGGMPSPSEREARAGLWTVDRYAWQRGPRTEVFQYPIPWVGRQRFFDVSDGASRIAAAEVF